MSKASVWHPYNVEPTEEAEVEVDDTQEIQIEEALKLYQTALKHHAEGPSSFDTTAQAYKALFESEIFKYTESLSEFQRHELYGETLVFDSILEDDFEAGPVQAAGAADSAPNTLPQLLHLSYKNHGRFLLESMQHWVTQHGPVTPLEGWTTLRNALNYFAEALDKEDIDLDLWLRAASVAAMLGSKRLTRYCLEAVLDGNDEQWESLLQLPGLEEAFAGQQLRDLVERMEDNVSLMQSPLSLMKRKQLSETLKKRLNPFPFAPLPATVADMELQHTSETPPNNVTLSPIKWDWAGVGEAILQHFMAEQRGVVHNVAPGTRVTFSLPLDGEPAASADTKLIALAQSTLTASPEQQSVPQPIDQSATNVSNTDASPTKASDDVEMEEQNGSAEPKTENTGSTAPLEDLPVPSRKRSTDSAGLPETAEGGRARSKRIRGRETISEGNTSAARVAQEANKQLDDQFHPYTHADECLYEIVKDIYQRLGVEGMKNPAALRNMLRAPSVTSTDAVDKAAYVMYTALQGGNRKAAQILQSNESFDLVGVTREAGLNAFLGFAKPNAGQDCAKPLLEQQQLSAFAHNINDQWLSIKEVAFEWIEMLLSRGSFSTRHENPVDGQSSYMLFSWAEDLKRHLVQVIVNADDYIYERMLDRVDDLNKRMLGSFHKAKSYELSDFDASQFEIIETLFELHLDIYSLIKHPNSQVDVTTQILQSDRLERWSILARDVIQLRTSCQSSPDMDDLALRHIWASVFRMSVREDIVPEHIVSAMGELKSIFQASKGHTIQVQNNAIMPELTIAAIDRELVRISMKDFFLKVFDEDEKDPVTIIESLEPILEEEKPEQPVAESDSDQEFVDARTSPAASDQPESPATAQFEQPSPILEMRKFLDGANVNVRLSLWHRLREAYDTIEYPPKVVSCFLRSIETLVKDLRSSHFQELTMLERQVMLLTRYRVVDEMVVKILQIIRDEKSAFDCLSYEHVQSSMSAIAELLHLLSATNVFRDHIRINNVAVPRFEGMPNSTFANITTKLDDMHLRLWILQYHLLREGISQNQENFPSPFEDLFEFLRHVHHATGVRSFCHFSTRQFLRLARDELLRFKNIDATSHDTELCQVLSDLYGLKLFIEPLDCHDFHTTPDALDKKTALSFLSFVMSQAKKVDIKDLLKTDLKGTIEKVHTALGRPKTNESISFNRKIISAYFKSSVSPVSLFNCLKGVGSLPTRTISPEEAVAASKGWYYMMGDIALSKFRSQKRMTQGPTEDLNYAQAFFVQDLEYSIENWKTWYRLAQANDTQLEEAVSWNADKLNSNTVELINFQRAAINCYIMAVACAIRDANATPESLDEMAQMYTEFGNRIYAASREPFSMEAFQIRENEKRFCNSQNQAGTYKDVPFVPLQVYSAWKFAATLFKRAIKGNPSKWWNYYMLGKCGWKMWSMHDNMDRYAMSVGAARSFYSGPKWSEVVDAFISAVETLPEKKGRSGEPVLEPHYKLVTIAHKLFQRKAIDHKKGVEILSHTSYAQNVNSPETADDWERYVLAVLKSLRAADKSSWHHRIIARSAHIIYDEGKDSMLALGAKHELTQQIFTKTMAVQVWKPENERPGRHFVYTTRYTKFFVELLDLTGDKANFEALAKRVRKKQTDFFEHQKLWQDMVLRYLKLLRKIGKVLDGQEDSAFKSVNHEEFNILALRLEAWCQNPTTQHPVLDVLRDAIEFKRLNNGLIKPLLIDDLIGDAYAMLYTLIGPTLPPLPSEIPEPPPPSVPPQPQPQPPQPFVIAPPPPPPPGSVPISSLMSVQLDGPADTKGGTLFSIYHPNQLQPQHPIPPPQPPPPAEPKPRAKAVGRREIARRAEAASQKPAGAIAPHSTAIPIRSPPTLNASLASLDEQTTVPEKSDQPTPASASAEHLQPPRPSEKSGTATAAASVSAASPEPSAPASVHDDADDESELSELDEEEVQEIEQEVEKEVEREVLRRSSSIATIKPLFPNLMANRSSPEKKTSPDAATLSGTQGTSAPDTDTIHIVVRKAAASETEGNKRK